MIELVGNDIEVNGEKVARVFDIRASLKDELHMAIERSNVSEEDIQNKIKIAFNVKYVNLRLPIYMYFYEKC